MNRIPAPRIGETITYANVTLTAVECNTSSKSRRCFAGSVPCQFDVIGHGCSEHECDVELGNGEYLSLIYVKPEDFALARLTRK